VKKTVIADPGEFSGQSGKVLHDDAYGMEAVGHEDGVGEPFSYQIAAGVGEVEDLVPAQAAEGRVGSRDRRRADPLALGQPGSANAVMVVLVNLLAQWLAAPVPRPDSRPRRHKVPLAVTAPVTPGTHHHLALPLAQRIGETSVLYRLTGRLL
jgi:hypothetical protein